MAMDALKNLTKNIPDWQIRIEELSGQVDKRQVELASMSQNPEVRSLRNKGSTESLRPKNDGPMHMCLDEEEEEIRQKERKLPEPLTSSMRPMQPTSPPSPPSTPSMDRVVAQRPILEPKSVLAPRPNGASHIKKKARPSSIASGDCARPAHRTRSMIIVYYDSYVQSFFDDLVRFVSSSRNLMRKAKMAAKVAQIKRLAEMEVSEDDNASADDQNVAETLPSLRFISNHRYGSAAARFGLPGAKNNTPDVYDELDKALEFVQSTCEHGAHQFLKDANCHDEIKKIKGRMAQVLTMAETEAERIQREEPELAKETNENLRPRTMRPITMARNLLPKEDRAASDVPQAKIEVADPSSIMPSPFIHVAEQIEVDPYVGDDNLDADIVLQKLRYRSTRHMRMSVK